MRAFTVFTVAAVLAVAASACVNTFTWNNLAPSSALVTEKVTLTTASGCYAAGQKAQMVLTGAVNKPLTDGHITMHIWEYNYGPEVRDYNYNYFTCSGGYDDMVCDPCEPIALVYDNCKEPNTFTLTMDYIMTAPMATGNYTISLLTGHYPLDIVLEVKYMYQN